MNETQTQTNEQVENVEQATNSNFLFDDKNEASQENNKEKEAGNNDNGKDNPEQQQQENQSEQEEIKALTADDIKIADGFEYDKELGDSFLSILNEAKINKETAQKFVDLYQSQQIKMLEGLKAADEEKAKKFEEDLAAEKAQWLKECQADKEFGGQNWEANQAVIDKAAREFSGAVKIMQAYNLQTHPEIVRMFYRAGKLISEDNSQISGNSAGKQIDPAEAIFGEGLKEYISKRRDNQ